MHGFSATDRPRVERSSKIESQSARCRPLNVGPLGGATLMENITSQPKRAPICGALSFFATAMGWLVLFGLIRLHPNGLGLLFGQLFIPFCVLGGLAFAIISWARRERFWLLPLVSLAFGFVLIGLICYVVAKSP